ncbi:hypothetical protein AMECASPLE_038528 [Ameca splendens]|uniref:Uncharacterized protein n=1 Tax=Ameca splendens TaxID=208324 RepID=A0ABV0ZVX0_9TELE
MRRSSGLAFSSVCCSLDPSCFEDGEGRERWGCSSEVHHHFHSLERVKVQMVLTSPVDQSIYLLSLCRLEADIFSGVPRVTGFPWESRGTGDSISKDHVIGTVQDKT